MVIMGLISLILLDRGAAVLFLDRYHNSFLDIFFKITTAYGEFIGFFISFVVLLSVSLIDRKKYIFMLAISALLSLVISQSCKHVLFSSEHRPSYYYNELTSVDGVDHHKNNSFPSGHTTAAFTFVTILAFGINKKWMHVFLPFLAAFVGVSRIYLGQHFLIDVVVGAIIGIFTATISFYFFDKFWSNRGNDKITSK